MNCRADSVSAPERTDIDALSDNVCMAARCICRTFASNAMTATGAAVMRVMSGVAGGRMVGAAGPEATSGAKVKAKAIRNGLAIMSMPGASHGPVIKIEIALRTPGQPERLRGIGRQRYQKSPVVHFCVPLPMLAVALGDRMDPQKSVVAPALLALRPRRWVAWGQVADVERWC